MDRKLRNLLENTLNEANIIFADVKLALQKQKITDRQIRKLTGVQFAIIEIRKSLEKFN